MAQSISNSQRYSGNIRQIREFILRRFNNIFSEDDEFEDILQKLNDFKNSFDDKNSYTKAELSAFERFFYYKKQLSQYDPSSDNYTMYLSYFKKAAIDLDKAATKQMNNFRSYFDNLSKNGDQQNSIAENKLIYLIASQNKYKEIRVSFTSFEDIIKKDLDDAQKLKLAQGSVLDDLLSSNRFLTDARLGKQDQSASLRIEQSQVDKINYFLNQVINGKSSIQMNQNQQISSNIITQIQSIIKVGDTYISASGNESKVTRARMVDILLGDDRLNLIGQGKWGEAATSLQNYYNSIITSNIGPLSRNQVLSKMMGENIPGVLEGDAVKFGQYDVQIKSQLGSSRINLLSTNALMMNWMMFSSPILVANIIKGNLKSEDIQGMEKEMAENGEEMSYFEREIYNRLMNSDSQESIDLYDAIASVIEDMVANIESGSYEAEEESSY